MQFEREVSLQVPNIGKCEDVDPLAIRYLPLCATGESIRRKRSCLQLRIFDLYEIVRENLLGTPSNQKRTESRSRDRRVKQ